MIPDLAVNRCRTNTNFDRSPLIDLGKGLDTPRQLYLNSNAPVMLHSHLYINIRIEIEVWFFYGMCRALPRQFNVHRMVLFRDLKT